LATRSSRRRRDELEYGLRYKRYEIAENFVRHGWKYGSLAFLGYCARDVLISFAGKYTFAEIAISFLGQMTITNTVKYSAIGGLFVWGMAERKLRQRAIARLSPRAETLELVIDSKRSSSNLTRRGTTKPEDAV